MHKRLTKFINCIYLLANTEHLTTCGLGDCPLRRPKDSAGVATDFSKIIFFLLNSFQEREKYFKHPKFAKRVVANYELLDQKITLDELMKHIFGNIGNCSIYTVHYLKMAWRCALAANSHAMRLRI